LRNTIKILTVFILFLFLSAGTMIYSSQQSVTELKEISFQKTKINKIEIILKIESAVQYEIVDLNVPTKLAIDFSPIQNISVEPWFEIQESELLSVKVEKIQLDIARVVLDFVERMPVYEIIQVEGGYKIELLFEETMKMVQVPKKTEATEEEPGEIEEKVQVPKKIETPEIKPAEIEKKEPVQKKIETPKEKKPGEIEEKDQEEISSRKKEPSYYVLLKNGFGNFVHSDFHVTDSFSLYGETGSISEDYRLDDPKYIFDLIFGKRFTLKNVKFKGSLGISLWSFNSKGNFQFSLPHPFIPNSNRSLTFTENSRNSYNAFYVSLQVSAIKLDKFQIWTGPIIGYARTKITSLEEMSFSETYPFSISDLSIT